MAYYSEDLIEEVISTCDIVEVISEYVSLKKRGRNYIGLCPFHKEKSPSFCVSMDKQIFKCFGCSVGGNVISFIMKIENMEFWESVEFLANRAHIDLARYEKKDYSKKINADPDAVSKEIMFKLSKDIAVFYNKSLNEILKKDNSPLKEYLMKRKLDMSTITKFGIGFDIGSNKLYEYLVSLGYKEKEILSVGVILKNDNGKFYDRFSNRLIFPIFDIRDKVIAFGGRVLDKSLPKYVNSPETDIYSKGRNLYGLNFVKREKQENILIVEGYMDCVSLHKAGITNAVASLGTALTENQASLIKRYTDTVIIGYDQDGAGQDATLRGLDILSKKGLNVKVLKLDKEDTKDPDEYVNKYGVERFKNCLKNSISLVEFKIEKLEKTFDINNMDQKIKLLTAIASILASIANNIERQMYIDLISKRYKIGTGPIISEIEKQLKKSEKEVVIYKDIVDEKQLRIISDNKKRDDQYIIALLMCKNKSIQQTIFDKINENDIQSDIIRRLFVKIRTLSLNYDISKIDILSKIEEEELIQELTEIMYIDVASNTSKFLNEVLDKKYKNNLIKRREEIILALSKDISKDESEMLNVELNQIILELTKR